MWGGWARELGTRLDATIRRPVSLDVFATIGFDPSTGRVAAGGPLATATMAGIEETVARVLRRWCPSIAAARRATRDGLVRPRSGRAGCPARGSRPAVRRAPRRRPPDRRGHDGRPRPDRHARSRALGVRDRVEAMVCGDDGFAVKPAPDAVFAVCHAFRTEPARVAVIGDTPADLRDGPGGRGGGA